MLANYLEWIVFERHLPTTSEASKVNVHRTFQCRVFLPARCRRTLDVWWHCTRLRPYEINVQNIKIAGNTLFFRHDKIVPN